MHIYREDSELQEERARRAMQQSKNQFLEDEIDRNLWKYNTKDSEKEKENKIEQEPIVLHEKIITVGCVGVSRSSSNILI